MSARQRKAGREARVSAGAWNEKNPPGTPVRYWPVLPVRPDYPPIETTTRSEAWELGNGAPVVLIVGRSGGVNLGHLEVIAPEPAKAADGGGRW